MDLTQAHKTTALVCLVAIAVQMALAAPSAHNKQSQIYNSEQSHTSNITVQTSSGLLVGLETPLPSPDGASDNQSSIIKFLGVPYARAPVGPLRFKRTIELPKEQAQVVLDSRRYGKTCPQFRHLVRFVSPLLNLDHEHQISEDCLQLNIFVPSFVNRNIHSSSLEPNKQLPVIVWLPGEGFDYADARQFDGSHLAHRTQSIVVTVQYRVGVLGFLDSRELDAPGNMAIHDQLMALKWVRRNINSLGGDSERVTLMGRFSGSMTISAMLTAPNQQLIKAPTGGESSQITTSLFKRAILMSGIAVDNWIIEDNQGEKVAGVLAAARERNYCTKGQVLDGSCLQTMPVDKLLEISGFGWKLVRDQQLIGREGPIEAVRAANSVPSDVEAILLGETETEGTLCLYRHMLTRAQTNYAQLIDEDRLTSGDMYDVIRDDSLAYFRYNVSAANPLQMALEALTSTADVEPVAREKYLDACSSYMIKAHNARFKRNIQASARAQERNTLNEKPVEIYHYGLKYKPTFSLAPDYIKSAAHGDDVPLVFGLVYNQPRSSIDHADMLMTEKMMAYIGNFVHGNQPLLQQHQQIDISPSQQQQQHQQLDASAEPNTSAARRSWTSDEQIHSLDMSDSEQVQHQHHQHHQHHQQQQLQQQQLQGQLQQAAPQSLQPGSMNLKIVVVEQPAAASVRPQLDYQHHYSAAADLGSQPGLLLLLSTSILIFTMMAICIILSVLVVRCNYACPGVLMGAGGKRAHNSSSASLSRCNVCDKQMGSRQLTNRSSTTIEAVMGQTGTMKNERTLCSVFAKLGSQRQCHSNETTTNTQQPLNPTAAQ